MNMDTIYILLLSCYCVSVFGMTLTTLTQRVRKCVCQFVTLKTEHTVSLITSYWLMQIFEAQKHTRNE